MKQNDTLSKSTEELLRAPLPDATPRPGFETRLLSQVMDEKIVAKPFYGSSPFLTACIALLAVLAVAVQFFSAPEDSTLTATPPAPPVLDSKPILNLDEFSNPLRKEATAMTDSATRAGQFLINCLPSLPDPQDSL